MIDLRNKIIDLGNKKQERKVCPVFPPIIVCVQTVNELGKAVTESEIRPIICFRENCEFFCDVHEMCIHRCEHLEMIHEITEERS